MQIQRGFSPRFCPGDVVEYLRSGHAKQNKAGSGRETEEQNMLTGTLIEDLIATVERAERKTQAEAELMAVMESWFVSETDSASYDNLRGVA